MPSSADHQTTTSSLTKELWDAVVSVSQMILQAWIKRLRSETPRPGFFSELLRKLLVSVLDRLVHLASWTVSKSSPQFIQPLVFDQETCSLVSSTMQVSSSQLSQVGNLQSMSWQPRLNRHWDIYNS